MFVFFGPIRKTRLLFWHLICWDIFTSPLNPLNGIQRNLTGRKISTSFTEFCGFFLLVRKTRWSPWPLIGWDISTSPLKPLNGIQRKLTGSKMPTSSTKFVFWGPIGKNKMAALASDWLRHFRLLLSNCWTEFNKTWQEARSQPLPILYFSGRSGNKNGGKLFSGARYVALLASCLLFLCPCFEKKGAYCFAQLTVWQVECRSFGGYVGLP